MSIDWIFGEYKILKKLATGGMAEVFLAKRIGMKGFEKLLAIKRILPQFAQNEEFIAMFIDEAKLAAKLNHRNIVQIYDFGSHQGSYYIAMEYVFGKDLRSVLKKSKEGWQRLPLAQCAYIITEAAKGLEYAHTLRDVSGKSLQIIHRDISPQNILLSYEGEVAVADFGIAKAASQSTETRVGVLKGKILYMSPEQAWGKMIDRRSDLYSLGVVLYEMVTNRKIFDADSEFSMLEKVRNAEVPFPPDVFADLPGDFLHIVKKALEKNPENRYQSAHEMRVDLENYLLTTQERLNEMVISDYLKKLFREEIEEEKKILTESTKILVEKPALVEGVVKPERHEPEKRSVPKSVPERKNKRAFLFPIPVNMVIILILCLLAGAATFYLLTRQHQEIEPPTPIEQPRVVEEVPQTDLLTQGPRLLHENKQLSLLRQIQRLPNGERQNINIKVLECFAHLKRFVVDRDKASKQPWGQLYKSLEHSNDRSATPLLLKIAKDPDNYTRLYAVTLLGRMGDQRAIDDLQKIAKSDPNRGIRKSAAKSIALIRRR